MGLHLWSPALDSWFPFCVSAGGAVTLHCLSVPAPCHLLVLLYFLSVVSGEDEVIFTKLFLVLIV